MWFKFAFVAAFVFAVTVSASTAREAARRHGGSLNQLSNEVRGLIFARAALGLFFYASLMAWLFWPAALRWMYVAVPPVVSWIGVALLLPTLAFFAWGLRSLGTNYRGGVGLYDGHALVTTGPYAWLRHPIYAAFIAIMLLVWLLSANWVLGLSGLLLVGSIAAARIPIEERELNERFGPSWEAYRVKTNRLIPRIWK